MRGKCVFMGMLMLAGCSDPAQPAKEAVMKDMKDPGSVQWRDITYFVSGNIVDVCGYFNGKNSFGAYTGFTRFKYTSGTLLVDGPGIPAQMFADCPTRQVRI